MRYRATITFKILSTHPDFQESMRGKTLEFTDVYSFDPGYEYDKEDRERYMKRDLALVAGGGYNTDHIYGVSYKFERM